VQKAVTESGVLGGLAVVFVPHTTAGVTINENADPDVKRDILTHLERMVPEDGDYDHAEGNSPGHIKASMMGFSATIIVSGGHLVLGTWQAIYFCEFDGPRSRKVHIEVRG
jgi:secondary thiamine-phosphate synthase enzyme